MEDETLASLRYCVQMILVPTIVLVGLLGNFVTVIVLTRRRMRCSTNVYLFFLAIVDMVFLLFNFILAFAHYPHLKRAKYELYWRLFGIFVWLVDGSSYSSIYLTVSFTIERYIAVCHPIRGQAMCTESRAKKVIAVVIVLCFFLTSTTPFEHMLESYDIYTDSRTNTPCNGTRALEMNLTRAQDEISLGLEALKLLPDDRNTSGQLFEVEADESAFCIKEVLLKAVPSDLGKNETYGTIVSYVAAILFTFVPLILLGTFNCFLVAAVRKSTKLRRDMTHSKKSQAAAVQENKMTVTLIAVVLLFLVCQTPTAIFLLYKTFVGEPDTPQQINLYNAIGNILNFLVTINAACNFILYCALSAKYRQTVKDIIFRRGRMKRQNTAHTRLSRYVSGTDASSRLGGGPSRSSRTPSFQADVRQKLNSSSRTPSFNTTNPPGYGNSSSSNNCDANSRRSSTKPPTRQQPSGGDRNRTSSISVKRPSISLATESNCLTGSNRGASGGGGGDVNRQYSGCSLAVPQSTPSAGRAKASSSSPSPTSDSQSSATPAAAVSLLQKNDSVKRVAAAGAKHLVRNSHSSASLTRSQSLVFPEQTKHSPNCKSHPMNK